MGAVSGLIGWGLLLLACPGPCLADLARRRRPAFGIVCRPKRRQPARPSFTGRPNRRSSKKATKAVRLD